MSWLMCESTSCLYGAKRTALGVDEFVGIIALALITLPAEHCMDVLNSFRWMDGALQGILMGNLSAHRP